MSDTSIFEYTAVSSAGVRRTGRMTADTEDQVVSTLQADGWTVIDISRPGKLAMLPFLQPADERPVKLKPAPMAAYARQLYQMLKAGVPMARALEALGEDQGPGMTRISRQMAARVSAGAPLSAAMSEHPKTFDDVVRAYVSAGERTGSTMETLGRMSQLLERRASLSNKIKAVTAYPKMVAGAIGMILAGIIVFLVPRYEDIYSSFDTDLPAPTQALVNFSRSIPPFTSSPFGLNFRSPVLWFLVFAGIWKIIKPSLEANPRYVVLADKVRFRLPIFGQLNKRRMLFQWTSTLSGGLSSGVQLPDALELAAAASGSRWQQTILPELQEGVRAGRPLSELIVQHTDLFPANVRSMVSTGEETGELDTMLDSVAVALDDEIDTIIAGLSSKIEVALLLFLGIVVGGIVVVMYLPLFNLATTVQSGL